MTTQVRAPRGSSTVRSFFARLCPAHVRQVACRLRILYRRILAVISMRYDSRSPRSIRRKYPPSRRFETETLRISHKPRRSTACRPILDAVMHQGRAKCYRGCLLVSVRRTPAGKVELLCGENQTGDPSALLPLERTRRSVRSSPSALPGVRPGCPSASLSRRRGWSCCRGPPAARLLSPCSAILISPLKVQGCMTS